MWCDADPHDTFTPHRGLAKVRLQTKVPIPGKLRDRDQRQSQLAGGRPCTLNSAQPLKHNAGQQPTTEDLTFSKKPSSSDQPEGASGDRGWPQWIRLVTPTSARMSIYRP
jgi:hypothetical protein